MKNIAIIYHSADFDGRLSNEVCRHWLPQLYPGAILHGYGWDYGQLLPALEEGSSWSAFDLIYIVDLSCPELMDAEVLRNKIVWIDHHASALKKYEPESWTHNPAGKDSFGVPHNEFWTREHEVSTKRPHRFIGYRIDGVAACRLCWQWFLACDAGRLTGMVAVRPEKQEFVDRLVEEPELIRLAGEYDIWDKRDPDAETLQHGLRTIRAGDWDRWIEAQLNGTSAARSWLNECLIHGRIIEEYVVAQNASIITGQGYVIRWQGLTFLCCNNARYNSLLFMAGLKPEHDALLGWKFDGQSISVSLYHAPGKEHHDLSQIAVRFGGGGHRGACGFKLPLSQIGLITSTLGPVTSDQ